MSAEIPRHDSHLDDADRRHQELMAVITDILIPDAYGDLDVRADDVGSEADDE